MISAIKCKVPVRYLRLPALLLCLCALFVSAQNQTAGAPVILGNKTVITIHWGYANFTPQVRATGIAWRLKQLADDSTVPLKLTQESTPLGINIRCGDIVVASVLPGDAQAENTTQEELAQQWSKSFLTAMQDYRAEYSWRKIALRFVLGLITVALCVWLLFLVLRHTGRIAARVDSALERRVKGTQSRMARLISDEFLHATVMRAFALLRLAIILFLLALAIYVLLIISPRTRPFVVYIFEGVEHPVGDFLHSVWTSLPSLLFIVVLAIATWYVIRLVRYFFSKVAEGAISIHGFRPAWSTVTERLVSISIVVLAILIAYPYIPGSQSPAFKGVSIFLGVLVSLGSTGLVANVITGIMLTYMDAFEVGDLVEIGEITAYVKSTSLLTTRLVTRKNEIITVPNSFIMGKHITNFSARGGENGLLIGTTVGIGYEIPWRQVEAMLLEAAARTESVAKDPAPFAIILLLDNYSVNYEINAYVKSGTRRYIALTELNHNVLDVFNEYGVAIMTPSYMSDPTEAKVAPKDSWFAAPASQQQTPQPPERQYPPPRPENERV